MSGPGWDEGGWEEVEGLRVEVEGPRGALGRGGGVCDTALWPVGTNRGWKLCGAVPSLGDLPCPSQGLGMMALGRVSL